MGALARALDIDPGPRSDTELVSACLSGDEQAWSELIDRYSRLIFSIPLRQGLTREEAADVYQAVCLDLVSELPKLRDPQALLGNLGVKGVEVPSTVVKKFEKLLVGGIWCIITLEYFFEEDQKGSPFLLRDLKPIQMPNMDMEELFEARRAFTEWQWIDALLRSTGMEPANFPERVKWHLLARMVPLYGRPVYEDMMRLNGWIAEYLPNARHDPGHPPPEPAVSA